MPVLMRSEPFWSPAKIWLTPSITTLIAGKKLDIILFFSPSTVFSIVVIESVN